MPSSSGHKIICENCNYNQEKDNLPISRNCKGCGHDLIDQQEGIIKSANSIIEFIKEKI